MSLESLLPIELLFLYLKRGVTVEIELKSRSTVITGVIVGMDQHMNLTLSEAVEVEGETSNPLGEILLKGDNIVKVKSPLSLKKLMEE